MRGADPESGQATLEFALCLPVLLAVLAAIVELGLIASDQVRLWHAAREAARVAVVEPDDRRALIAAEAVGLSPLDMDVEPDAAYRLQGETLTVELSYEPRGHVPLIGVLTRSLHLRAQATMRIEQP